MATVRPYLGRNSQYGFAFHFGVVELPGGGAIEAWGAVKAWVSR